MTLGSNVWEHFSPHQCKGGGIVGHTTDVVPVQWQEGLRCVFLMVSTRVRLIVLGVNPFQRSDTLNSWVMGNLMGRRFGWVVDGFFLGGTGGGRETVRTRSPGSVFSRWHTFLNGSIFYVIYYIFSSGGFTVSCLQTIVNGVPDSRYPGQTRVLFDNLMTSSTH